MMVLDSIERIEVGEETVTADVGYRAVVLYNNSEGMIYFAPGDECAAESGYPLWPGEQTLIPMRVKQLAVVYEPPTAEAVTEDDENTDKTLEPATKEAGTVNKTPESVNETGDLRIMYLTDE